MLEAFKEKRFALILLAILVLLPVLSCGGALAESSTCFAETIEHGSLPDGTLSESLPCPPSATYRFSGRVNRTIPVPGGRIRPWTPAELDTEKVSIDLPLPVCAFETPENVKISFTTNTICTSPVRAGPEYIFS